MKKYLFLLFTFISVLSMKAQTDSLGIFAVYGASLKRIDITRPTGAKISSAIFIGKTKVYFDGSSSETHFNGKATFRVFYGTPSIYDASKYFMFTPSYSVKDLSIAQMKVKKDSRQLVSSTIAIIGTSRIGTEKAKNLKIEVKEIRQNVYEIEVTGPAGEYCILPVLQGIATPYSGVFAFTIDSNSGNN